MCDSRKLSCLNYWTEPHNFWRFLSDASMLRCGDITIGGAASRNPKLEGEIIDKAASYGRQLGWLLDAMVIIAQKMETMANMDFTPEEKRAFEKLYALKTMIDVMKTDAARARLNR